MAGRSNWQGDEVYIKIATSSYPGQAAVTCRTKKIQYIRRLDRVHSETYTDLSFVLAHIVCRTVLSRAGHMLFYLYNFRKILFLSFSINPILLEAGCFSSSCPKEGYFFRDGHLGFVLKTTDRKYRKCTALVLSIRTIILFVYFHSQLPCITYIKLFVPCSPNRFKYAQA